MNNDKHVIAVFNDRLNADNAINALIDAGFNADDLSLMVSENGRDHHFKVSENKSKTAESVGYGAVLGGLAAGLGTLAAGVVSVTIPGAIVASGPLAVSLAAGAAGAAAGGLAGGLVGVGIPADEVSLVEKEIADGSIIVAAHSLDNEQEERAKQIFDSSGAVRVH